MKTISRIAALTLALCMLLTVCFAEEAPVADVGETVLVTIDGDPITKSEVDETLELLYNNSYVSSLTDYATGLQYIVQNYVIGKKITELGLDQFTDEENAAFTATAQSEWDAAVEEYVTYYLSEDTEEARAELVKAANEYYTGQGYSVEQLAENAAMNASYERLESIILDGKDTAATEDEIKTTFDMYAGYDKESYAGNVAMYEYYTQYMGQESWYIPDGYRGVTHILLEIDDALLSDYQTKLAAYEEQLSASVGPEPTVVPDMTVVPDPAAIVPTPTPNPTVIPEATAVPVTIEDVEAAKLAIIASVQDKIDDIQAKFAAGTPFNDLIDEYGTDAGMKDAATLESGYLVNRDSIMYDGAFIDAAFSAEMTKQGDISLPVVGTYGVHILYYLRDIPGGNIEITDTIRADIENYLVSQKKNALYAAAIESWTGDYEIVYNQEAIDEFSAAEAVTE